MSYPANPLDKYQSYSYHHFLIAASTTEVIRQIETGQISFGNLSGLRHGQTISAASGGKAVMVMNSAVDSKFYIDHLSFSAIFVDVSDSNAKLTQMTELEMTVKEPNGATFINFLRSISDDILETSYNSVCFMLKTFFVGHEADGSTTRHEVNPITLMMSNMDSTFDVSGGTHSIKFFGASNGAPLKNGNLHYVNRNLNLVTNNNSILLKDLIIDFEKKLNSQLEEQWNLVKAQSGGNGRKVKYKFTLPKDWDNYTVKSTSKDNYVERLFDKEKQALQADQKAQKALGTQNKPGIEADRFKTNMNTSVRTTVTQILSEIFKHCDQIHEAFINNSGLTKEKQHLAKLHQIVSSITSDDKLMTVHFDVLNYYLPRLPSDTEKKLITKVTESPDFTANQFDKFGITFEYLFTGKSSDIIQLDVKADHTNMILITNQVGVQKATGNMTATGKSVESATDDQKQVKTLGKEVSTTLTLRKYDAVYLPDLPADAQHGYIYAAPDSAALRAKYTNMLALLAAKSTQNMHVIVRGNPYFLNHSIRPLFPHNDRDYDIEVNRIADIALKKSIELKAPFDVNNVVHMFGDVANHVPQFVKIVIKTPTFDDAGTVIGYEPFWYQGRYRITKITNHFNNGSFQQELFLLPYDLEGAV
jgi:hypothetical protein